MQLLLRKGESEHAEKPDCEDSLRCERGEYFEDEGVGESDERCSGRPVDSYEGGLVSVFVPV